MSEGLAIPTLDTVSHTVAFPSSPPIGDYAVPHTGASPLTHLTHGHDLSHAVSHGAGAALHTLESLSGFLLAGRAALLTTRVLAQAAVRAAGEQRCLERQEEIAVAVAEQWQAAAYAAARANARCAALASRMRRALAAPGGGGGEGRPPRPDLPPPLEPVGQQLGAFRTELARFEEAVRRTEEAWTAWEIRRLTTVLETADADDAWQRMLRDRQEAMLNRHMKSRSTRTEQQAEERPSMVPPRATPEQTRDTETVRQMGADILTSLDPQVDRKTAARAAEAVGHAVRHAAGSPSRARRHLNDARAVVRDANRAAEARRAQAEWAATQLDFLTRQPPKGTEPLPEAPDAVAALERVLDEGGLLSAGDRALVERRVRERHDRLHTLFVHAQCSRVLAELADFPGDYADTALTRNQEIRLDWTPDGWEPDHWLRASLADGAFRVTTMYRGSPGERTPVEQQLDNARCEEAQRRLDEFSEVARDLGLTVHFRIERAKGARPGLPGEDGAVLLGKKRSRSGRRSQDNRHANTARTVGDAHQY